MVLFTWSLLYLQIQLFILKQLKVVAKILHQFHLLPKDEPGVNYKREPEPFTLMNSSCHIKNATVSSFGNNSDGNAQIVVIQSHLNTKTKYVCMLFVCV